MKEMNQNEISEFINQLDHSLKLEFLELRNIILTHFPKLNEHIKWNAPSYQINNEDCLTFNFSNKKEIRLILHRGALSKIQPQEKLIKMDFVLLKWASNDRAIITFSSREDVDNHQENLISAIEKWLNAIV